MDRDISHDARVLQALERFWSVYDNDADGKISKEEYMQVHVKLALVLIPDITPEEALHSGEDDWLDDAKGEASMEHEGLFDCLFLTVRRPREIGLATSRGDPTERRAGPVPRLGRASLATSSRSAGTSW